MDNILILIFILGYLTITLEHFLKIDKLIPALLMMVLMWAVISVGQFNVFRVDEALKMLVPANFEETLLHHFGKTTEILIFLIGAMTIVEIIDHFNGFSVIKGFVKTKSKRKLILVFCILGFFLSAVIDNLTATIILISILRKIVKSGELRMWYASLIVIAANSGGAWSPIGDVTTTMLWIANKVTTLKLITNLFIPSIISLIVPAFIASFLPIFKGNFEDVVDENEKTSNYSNIMFYIGLSAIVFVPIFKTITHLPPYLGMMFSLSIVAIVAEFLSFRKLELTTLINEDTHVSPIHKSLSRIELPSILFFLGILMAVAAMESVGNLFKFSEWLSINIPNIDLVVIILGFSSAVIDNVPLVAASIGMFQQGIDDSLWHFIAFSAGTGGSMLIIGSAAGVVAMGMERINFFWYFKNIAWLAALGFLAGAFSFILLQRFI
ncbi:sodium:proton antiporter NhaD [Lutibacter sp.]|uniref:sodium:proton antiporter NhaD n=1 Tax=Lutibacter sp. TaxID=1925666 RepID=UPI0027322F1B|nr:sodium:proton antiporter NhaD [Lutibacter sp.]MDP3313056.1 sodium:proton antiporter NhaD [Lutibacter sp.]